MKTALLLTPDKAARDTIAHCLSPKFQVTALNRVDAETLASAPRHCDVVFVDLDGVSQLAPPSDTPVPGTGLQTLMQQLAMAEVIVMSTSTRIRELVTLIKAGASNYLTYPVSAAEVAFLIETLEQSSQLHSELDYLRDRFWQAENLEIARSDSPVMRPVLEKVRMVAPTRSTVLLTGETGTGKGVVAKLIHSYSTRIERPFIAVHCAAIPEPLLESELFGHEKGAFTGAVRRKLGKFEVATGGTLFLDEIGTISLSTQIKLLQALQERVIHRLGGEAPVPVDVRIIAATNEDLPALCENGRFRLDLYYRLNVFPVEIPPLRYRSEDIPILASFFLDKLNRYSAKSITRIHPEVMAAFRRYPWPGNIRELENLIERAYILENGDTLGPDTFPPEIFSGGPVSRQNLVHDTGTLAEVRQRGVELIEKQYLRDLLTTHAGRIIPAAAAAGISRRQLHSKLVKYGIGKADYKPPRGK